MENIKYLFNSLLTILLLQSINTFTAELPAKNKKQLSQTEQQKLNNMLWRGISTTNENLVKNALENGANPNNINTIENNFFSDFIPLEAAIFLTHKDNSNISIYENIIRLLLQFGADPNYQNEYGVTQFMNAASNIQNESIIKLFLDSGANTNITDNNGRTALDFAKRRFNRNQKIEKIIEEAQEKRRLAVRKEIIESAPISPELADIASEYAEHRKPAKAELMELGE